MDRLPVKLLGALAALATLAVGADALAYGPRASPNCVTGAATGTTWYACDCYASDAKYSPQSGCTAGNDAAAGTSPATALQHLDAVRTKFVSAHDGDRIALCQGGVFQVGSESFDNANFTVAGGGGVIYDYAATWGGGGIRPWLSVPIGQDAISFVNGSSVHGSYTVANIGIHGQGSVADLGQEFGIFVYGKTTNVTACNVRVDNMQIGMDSARNVETDRVPNMILRDSIIENCWGQGWLGGDSGTQVIYNHFENNGTRSSLDHNIYLVGANGSDPTQPSIGLLVQGNELHKTAWTSGTGCKAAEFTAHGLLQDLSIIGNHVWEDIGTIDPGCWGIAPAPGYVYTEKLTNVVVSENLIENVGNVSIAAGSWNGGSIRNNALINRQGVNDKLISMSENECHTTGTGSCSDSGGTPAGGTDFTLTGVDVINNSGLTDAGTVLSIRSGGSGYHVYNNAAYHTGGGTPTCFDYPLSAGSYSGIDYNDCFISGGTGNHWQGSQSLATWTGASGFDTHSLVTSPAFLALTSPYNLAVLATSPIFDTGSTAFGSSTDIMGVSRPQGAATDIGAYELLVVVNPSIPGRNRPISYGGWFLLALFVLGVGALAGHLSVKRRRAELADVQHVHYIDAREVAALAEMADDGLTLMLATPCSECGEPLLLPRKRKG